MHDSNTQNQLLIPIQDANKITDSELQSAPKSGGDVGG